jgi:type I restriction enzyme S subunit
MIENTEFFKETEFQDSSIGRIPSDWDSRELGDESIAGIIAGQSPPSSTYSKENQGLPFLQGKTEFGDMFPSPTVYCLKPIKIAKKDDILLSVRAPVGDVNIAPFECCIGRGLAAIRTKKDRLSHMFLYYYLRLEGRRFEALSTGSTFKAIRMKEIEEFQVPLPPVSEQKAIVGVLGVVDSAIELADKVIAKTERLKKGLMQQLLTHGIGYTEYKNTPIGKIPKTWQIVELKEILDVLSGQYFKFSEFTVKGVKCLKIDNVGFGNVVWDTNTFLPSNYEEKYHKLVLKEGDIVLALNRPIIDNKVKVGMVTSKDWPSILYQRVGKVIIKDASKVDNQFLLCTFTGEYFKNQLGHSLVGTDQPYIRTPILLKIKIPLPPKPEQQRIVTIISGINKKLDLENREKIRLEQIKQGLMDLLLTGKVRIKVD